MNPFMTELRCSAWRSADSLVIASLLLAIIAATAVIGGVLIS